MLILTSCALMQDADLGHIYAWTMREVEAAQQAALLERPGIGYPSERRPPPRPRPHRDRRLRRCTTVRDR